MNPKFPTRRNPAWPTEEAYREALYAERSSKRFIELDLRGFKPTSPSTADEMGLPATAEHLRRTPMDNGGQAFPYDYANGMTLRDWFAGQILASGILDTVEGGSVEDAKKELGVQDYDYQIHWPMLRAKYAYKAADAMIAERKKGGAA